jgi:hypothetical protein
MKYVKELEILRNHMKHTLLIFGLFSLIMEGSLWGMETSGPDELKEIPVEKEKIEAFADTEVTPGIYEHFKDKEHRYEVVGVARNSESPRQEYVVYKSLYDSELKPEGTKLPSGTLWIRPKRCFLSLSLIQKIQQSGSLDLRKFHSFGL